MTAQTSNEPAAVGPYRLVQKLGEGGMGVVHLGLDGEGRAVAVKVMRAHIAGDPDARRRLDREVQTLRRVKHPRVAEVIDADVEGAVPYLVTRFVPGKPLDVHVKEHGPLPRGHIARIGQVLADALRAIHAAGIVHRDVKPANVMLLDGEPVLIDFGIAHVADETRLTHTGLVMGTPGYLSPEVIGGGAVTEATDWWGWGATLAFAATGRSPFGGGPIEVVLDRVRRGDCDLDGLTGPLRVTLLSALTVNPDHRPPPDQLVAGLAAPSPKRNGTGPITRPEAPPGPAERNDDVTKRRPSPAELAAAGAAGAAAAASEAPTSVVPPPGRDAFSEAPTSVVPPPGEAATTRVPPPSEEITGRVPPPWPQPPIRPQEPATEVIAPSPATDVFAPSPTRRFDPPAAAPAGPPAYGTPPAPRPVAPAPPPPPGYGQQRPLPQPQPPAPARHQPAQQPLRPPPPPGVAGRPAPPAPGEATFREPPPAPGAYTAGVLPAGLVTLSAMAVVAPYGAVVLAGLGMAIARVVDRSSVALLLRRQATGGPRGSDAAVTAAALPWRILKSGIVTLFALILPLLVGISVAFIVGMIQAGGSSPTPTEPLPLFCGMAALLLTAWYGPGGGSVRRGGATSARWTVRGRRSRIGFWSLVVLLLLSVVIVVSNGSSPDFGPIDGLPLMNQLQQIGGRSG